MKLQTLIKDLRYLYNESYVFQPFVEEEFFSSDFIWEGCMRNKYKEFVNLE